MLFRLSSLRKRFTFKGAQASLLPAAKSARHLSSHLSHKRRGFTLVELIGGTVVLAIIGTLCYGALYSAFKTQKILAQRSDLQELGTALLTKVKIDLSQTFHVESRRPITQFKGEDLGDLDKISFTALVHIPSDEDAHESDQALVTYQLTSNPDDAQLNILQRQETPLIAPKDDAEIALGELITVASNITQFNIEYFNGEKYIPTWDINSALQRNKLPKLIRINLSMRDDNGREQNFMNVVELPMWQNLNETPAQKKTNTNNNSNNNSGNNNNNVN